MCIWLSAFDECSMMTMKCDCFFYPADHRDIAFSLVFIIILFSYDSYEI